MKKPKSDKARFKEIIQKAKDLVRDIDCECWEGCNDREGKLPCPHDILFEGIALWELEFNTVKKARYK